MHTIMYSAIIYNITTQTKREREREREREECKSEAHAFGTLTPH
jgi:hypothetical protein